MLRQSIEKSVAEKFRGKKLAWDDCKSLPATCHRVYLGDAREMTELGRLPFVHLVVTSPPYWTLKKYPSPSERGQLGSISEYQKFQLELGKVWQRCFELLFPGGRMCIVVGDVCLSRRAAGRHSVIPLHADITTNARACGFDYLSPIYWHKIANATTEVQGNGSRFLGKPYEPNGIIKNDVEYILIFRKPGEYRHPTEHQRLLSIISKEDHQKWFRQIWSDIPGESTKNHPAPFPEELAFRLISMYSFVGDTILDPFWGSGNTTAAAQAAHRSSIGYEIEAEYFHAARNHFSRLNFEGNGIEFVERKADKRATRQT
jgi:site-specific DNA-methyltransferase (adenine-specific)